MIVIFEGIEGSGKTTLCEKFAEASGLQVYKDPARHGLVPFDTGERTPKQWAMLGNQANLDIAEFSTMADFIVDRWAMSSMVYDFIRGEYYGDEFYKDLVSSVDHRVYLLDCSPFVANDRLLKRDGKSKAKPIQYLDNHKQRFLEVASKWNLWGGNCAVFESSDLDTCWKHLKNEADRISRGLV